MSAHQYAAVIGIMTPTPSALFALSIPAPSMFVLYIGNEMLNPPYVPLSTLSTLECTLGGRTSNGTPHRCCVINAGTGWWLGINTPIYPWYSQAGIINIGTKEISFSLIGSGRLHVAVSAIVDPG